ncbi:cytochrome c [Collimonas sp. OK307]|uniref:c-type cytochrome n=1 Tax=Collimonas sp. OK307 TaxID=1801620 RepID=UPI000B8614D5|nr:cytochrome c [Collimonas sp. OK307]
MKTKFASLIIVVVICATAALIWAWQPVISAVGRAATSGQDPQLILRGQHIVALGDCMVCHTSKAGEPYAGGLPLRTPFGTIYTTNITPDPDTGIGSWSLEAFKRAIRYGVSRDGHLLYPAFPYIHYTQMSDTDIEAAYHYLMSRTPVSYMPPDNELLLPLRFRPLLAFWNLLYLRPGERPITPAADQQIERGRYLVNSLGHCASCHSALNVIGGEAKPALGGGSVDAWEAPALTALAHGRTPWTAEQLETYLRSGISAQHGAAKGPMRPVTDRLADASQADVAAIAKYVMSIQVAAAPSQQQTASGQPLPQQGAVLFAAACASCHSASAPMSMAARRPSLTLSRSVTADTPVNLIQTVLGGVPWTVPHSGIYMPPFADVLTDEQIASVAQFVRVDIGKRPPWLNLPQNITYARKEMLP